MIIYCLNCKQSFINTPREESMSPVVRSTINRNIRSVVQVLDTSREVYKGINELDKLCKMHDQFYNENKDTKDRNMSDVALAHRADEIARNSNFDDVQRKDARFISGIMKTKAHLGFGVKTRNSQKSKKLPTKIKDLVKLVMKSKYYKVPIQNIKLSEKKNTAFKNNAIVYKLKVLNPDDPLNQMMLLNTRKTYLLDKRLNLLKGIKCNETLEDVFEKLGSEGQVIEKSFTFTSRPQVIMSKTGIESALQNMRSDIEIRIDRFTMEGSGWAVIGLLNHDLSVNKYDPLAGRSYIPLPAEIQNRKATVNLKNDDDRCFIYCFGRALDPNPEKNHLDRVSTHLKNVCETLGLNTIKTPVNIQNLPKIEKQFNVSINIYGHSNSDIYPINSTYSTAAKHIDLLVTSNSETNHYVWIKNFNRLCYNVNKHARKKYFCKHCIQHFTSESIY